MQVLDARNLAGSVAFEREARVFFDHPFAVVDDANAREPRLLGLDRDPPRAGVERVLDQLLDDARRPLDHLAGGDLVREIVRELVDFRHSERAPNPSLRRSRIGRRVEEGARPRPREREDHQEIGELTEHQEERRLHLRRDLYGTEHLVPFR